MDNNVWPLETAGGRGMGGPDAAPVTELGLLQAPTSSRRVAVCNAKGRGRSGRIDEGGHSDPEPPGAGGLARAVGRAIVSLGVV